MGIGLALSRYERRALHSRLIFALRGYLTAATAALDTGKMKSNIIALVPFSLKYTFAGTRFQLI